MKTARRWTLLSSRSARSHLSSSHFFHSSRNLTILASYSKGSRQLSKNGFLDLNEWRKEFSSSHSFSSPQTQRRNPNKRRNKSSPPIHPSSHSRFGKSGRKYNNAPKSKGTRGCLSARIFLWKRKKPQKKNIWQKIKRKGMGQDMLSPPGAEAMEMTPKPVLKKKYKKNAKRNGTFSRLLKQRKMMQAPDTRAVSRAGSCRKSAL